MICETFYRVRARRQASIYAAHAVGHALEGNWVAARVAWQWAAAGIAELESLNEMVRDRVEGAGSAVPDAGNRFDVPWERRNRFYAGPTGGRRLG